MTWYEEKYQWGITTLPGKTTKAQWDEWRLDMMNHRVRCQNKRDFLKQVLDYSTEHGLVETYKHFLSEIDMAESMDRPNEPGYYRAAND